MNCKWDTQTQLYVAIKLKTIGVASPTHDGGVQLINTFLYKGRAGNSQHVQIKAANANLTRESHLE